jgi:EmrB/QacA subfamily drug resistance transporter
MTERKAAAEDVRKAAMHRPRPDDVAPGGARPDHRPGIALAVVLACQLLVAVDLTIVNIALPRIQASLHFSATGLSWVFDAYALTFGGLLLLGGRAGDILGRRRTLICGVTVFTLASLAGGLASTPWWLVAARALQGAGGALIAPNVLAIIATNFEEGPRRNRAISLFGATASGSLALGLIIGGMLTAWASWRLVFFVNVPIGCAIAVLAPRFVRETERHHGRFDLPGAVTVTAGTAVLVYAFLRAPADGWSGRLTLGCLSLAAILIAVFLGIEMRADQPIMPLRLFADRNRTGAYIIMLFAAAAMFDIIYFLTQYLQEGFGYSPLAAGFAFLPMTLTIFAVVRAVPRLLPRYGPKPILVTGTVLTTAAMAWLIQISAGSGYATAVLGPLVLFGTGMALTLPSLTVTILSGIARHDSGAASGILQTMQWIGGGSLGLGIFVSVYATASGHTATHPLAATSQQAQAHDVLAHGVAAAFAAGTALALCAVLSSIVLIKTTKRLPAA